MLALRGPNFPNLPRRRSRPKQPSPPCTAPFNAARVASHALAMTSAAENPEALSMWYTEKFGLSVAKPDPSYPGGFFGGFKWKEVDFH